MVKRLRWKFRELLRKHKTPKIFCIGRNKTGTTSLERALKDLGFVLEDQASAELLIHEYAQRNFRAIVDYCRSADAFQDTPFSLPYTYQSLDYAYPGSKFILSVRDDEDEWYRSLIRFNRKRLGVTGKITKEALQNDPYRYRGYRWEVNRIVYGGPEGGPENDPYNEEVLKEHYRRHNAEVVRYFAFRDDLLVINLREPGSYMRFCEFLGVEPLAADFPWLNRSA